MKSVTLILLASILVLKTASADLLGQIDTFDSHTQGWASGANPIHVGAGGAGDNGGFLQISRPVGASFHMAAYNSSQWTGDFLTAGITSLEMDLNHITGPDAVNVRLMLWGAGGVWASANLTPVADGWNHYSFGLSASDLVFVNTDTNAPPHSGGGTSNLADTLQNINIIQLRHDYPTPTLPGSHPQHISATLGIDNVQSVPEPATLLYLLVAAGGLLLARPKQSRRG